jgi:hypothetical protein
LHRWHFKISQVLCRLKFLVCTGHPVYTHTWRSVCTDLVCEQIWIEFWKNICPWNKRTKKWSSIIHVTLFWIYLGKNFTRKTSISISYFNFLKYFVYLMRLVNCSVWLSMLMNGKRHANNKKKNMDNPSFLPDRVNGSFLI